MSNFINISGPFTRVKGAPISTDIAKQIKDGEADITDVDIAIEDHEAVFSIYGADAESVVVSLDGIFEHTIEEDGWFKNCELIVGEPKELFLEGKGLKLDTLDKNKIYAILIESFEGEEKRAFDGKFDQKKLSIYRVKFSFEQQDFVDLIQVNYDDSEIIDETEGEFHALYILENGKLSKAPY